MLFKTQNLYIFIKIYYFKDRVVKNNTPLYFMNKKQAVEALTSQKKKLNSSFQFGDSIWIGVSLDYIERIFTKESQAYKALIMFRPFDIKYADENYPLIKEKLNKMFEEWIEMVKRGAFNQTDKKNFLYRLSDSWLITIFTVVVPAIFILGYNVGVYLEKQKNSLSNSSAAKIDIKDSATNKDSLNSKTKK